MRIGQNPNKAADAVGIEPVVLAVVTHLPNTTTAYHAKRMEVIQTCLTSMRQGANTEHTFAVWDNGSIPELRRWLQWDFKPDVFVQSPNIGKTAARTSIFRMFHPDTVVCYSDDDMLFYDDWLRPQLELLQHFPGVACVSGYPVRTSFRWGNENTKAWARKYADLQMGYFLPQEWEADFALSVGREPAWHKEYSKGDLDYLITYKGKKAYATAHHCQFIGRAETVGRVLQYDGKAMGDEKPFDIALDRIGLRLATTQRLCRHIGNVLHDELRKEFAAL
jgi:hypothetical protein